MLDLLFSEVNTTLTILSIVFASYWILTLLFGLDLELDFDTDIDIDLDADVDISAEGIELEVDNDIDVDDVTNTEVDPKQVVRKRRKQLKWWQVLLIHFNFVGVPLMFTLTSWILILWVLTLLATGYTNTYNTTTGFVWLFSLIIPSLYITKLITTPFKSFFNMFNKNGNAPVELIGKMGVLLDNLNGKSIARAEIIFENTSLTINVQSLNHESIKSGENILVIKASKDKTIYFVQAYNSSI